jgi:acyl carrier protein
MTTVEQVWEEAGRRGIELKLDGDNLRVRADRGALTAELTDALRRHKPELIERLRKVAPGHRVAPPLPVAEKLENIDSPATSPWSLRMAAFWCELLELQTVPLDASFFDVGGHSLLATHLADRLSEELGTEVPISIIFDHPTIRELESWIAQRSGANAHEVGKA